MVSPTWSRTFGPPRVRWAVFLIAALLACGTAIRFLMRPVRLTRTLRIGFQKSPPYHFPDENGNASGPMVDLLQIAARRAGVRIQWVFAPKGPEESLASGHAELWPLVADLPERHSIMYISKPWARITYSLLVPESYRPGDPIPALAVNGPTAATPVQPASSFQSRSCVLQRP